MGKELIAAGSGFSIEVAGDTVRFSRAPSGSLSISTIVTAGLAVLFVINGGIQLALGHIGAGILLLILSGAAAFVARWRSRVRSPGAVVHLSGGQLCDQDGKALTAAADARVKASIDWTDGMGGLRFARVLSLRWPGGRLPSVPACFAIPCAARTGTARTGTVLQTCKAMQPKVQERNTARGRGASRLGCATRGARSHRPIPLHTDRRAARRDHTRRREQRRRGRTGGHHHMHPEGEVSGKR